jgi:hypothetical protein
MSNARDRSQGIVEGFVEVFAAADEITRLILAVTGEQEVEAVPALVDVDTAFGIDDVGRHVLA